MNREQLIQKALWYKNRLLAMSPQEIVHRLQERARREIDKHHRFTPNDMHDPGSLPSIPGLREGLAALPSSLAQEWSVSAEKIRSGQFHFLGLGWPASSGTLIWHLDPVTNTAWPNDCYCFSVDFRHNAGRGDVKYVWELNRLQFLQPLAALAAIRQDEDLARFCLNTLESWMEANPPYQGVNWVSGIELALRAISMLVITSCAGEYATPAQRIRILQSLQAHGYWIARYPSAYSSANNHRTAEGLGLFAIGTLCPAFAESAGWRKTGWDILCETARLLILEDGIGAEQSITYTAAVLEELLFGLRLAQNTNLSIPAYYPEKVQRAAEALRWFVDSSGHHPRIGDDDDAVLIGVWQPHEHYVASIINCAASMLPRPELAISPAEPHLRHALFGNPLPAADTPKGLRTFNQGGYTVARQHNAGRDVLLAFDHGYLGYLSIAAHGHADALSVWLHVGGQPLFVDAGTYLYHGAGEWRTHFRGTAAHNTLMLEQTDSSTMAGAFNWSHKANAQMTASGEVTGGWWVEASHDGYETSFGVTHHRKINYYKESFQIEDRLSGKQSQDVQISFLLHPDITVEQQNKSLILSKGGTPLLRIDAKTPLSFGLEEAWYSPSFGIKNSASKMVWSGTLGPLETSTLQMTIL